MKKIGIGFISILLSVNSFSQNDFSLLFGNIAHEVIIPVNTNFDNVIDSFSICAWIKPINIASGGEGSAIIARRDYIGNTTGERTHFMFGVKENLSLRFMSNNNSNTSLYTFQAISVDSVVNYGVWNFVCATFNQGMVKMYVDGALIYTHDFGTKELFPYNHLISIGKVKRTIANNSFAPFGGMIDELSLWDDDLSDSLINQYMTCPPIGTEPELLAYWKFEEGINSTTLDETSYNNDGTISPGTQWFTDVPTKFCSCNPTLNPTYNINGCDSISIHGNMYFSTQTVIDTVAGTFGCDSVITTNLIMNFLVSTNIDTSIAHNQTLYVGGAIQNTSGLYFDTLKATSGCDSVITTNLTILPVGINSKINSAFTFYPNPTYGIVNVSSSEKGLLAFYSVQGQLMKEVEICKGGNKFNIKELKPGSYILKVSSKNGVFNSLLIKE